MSDLPSSEPDWVHGHPHEPNPAPPSADPTIALDLPQGRRELLTVADLSRLPQQQVDGCYIVSTGHGRSGPFRFTGVILLELLRALWPSVDTLHHVDVIAADGFGTRLTLADLDPGPPQRPPFLALQLDGQPLLRSQGLVRLITPEETTDALRQVKWVSLIVVVTGYAPSTGGTHGDD